MDSSLRLVVTGDSQSAVDALNKVNTSMKAVSSTVPSFGSALSDAKERVETLTAKLYLLNREALSGNIGKGLSAQLREAKKDLADLEHQAGITGERMTNVFSQAYSSIRRLAFILPGIGVAGIFNLIFEAIGAVSKKTEEADKALKEYQNSINEVVNKTADEASKVEVLVGQLQKGTLSRRQTVDAINELKKISPEYFGNLNAEKSSISDITKAYAAYNAQIIQTIETQIRLKDIQDIVAKRLDFARNAKEANDEFSKLLFQGKSLAEIAKIATDRVSDQNRSLNQLLNSEKGRFATGKDILNQEALEAGALLQLVTYRQQEKDIIDQIQGAVAKQPVTKEVDEAKARLNVLEQIKRVQDEIDKPSNEPIFKQARNTQLNDKTGLPVSTTDIEILRARIAEAIQGGLKDPANKDVFDQLANTLNTELQKIIKPVNALIRFDFLEKGSENPAKAIEEQFKKLDKEAYLQLTIHGFNQKSVEESLKIADKIGNDFARTLNNALEAGIAAAARTLASGNIKGLFSDLEGIIGDGLESLGKALLAAFPIIKIAKEAIANAIYDPELIAVAGVLAIAAGAAIKSLASKKGIHAFAEGGIITGPTLGLVGEAGPEVVFPLDRLNQFIKKATTSNNVQVAGEFGINGNDLKLVLARTNKNQGLV